MFRRRVYAVHIELVEGKRVDFSTTDLAAAQEVLSSLSDGKNVVINDTILVQAGQVICARIAER